MIPFLLFSTFASLCVIIFALVLGFGILGSFTYDAETTSAYECGFEPLSVSRPRFCIKFFLVCVLFILFDVEIGFVVPFLCRVTLVSGFLVLLVLGLGFEYAYGGLDWLI